MAALQISNDDFTLGDDTVINTPGTLMEFNTDQNPALYAALFSTEELLTGPGNDALVALANVDFAESVAGEDNGNDLVVAGVFVVETLDTFGVKVVGPPDSLPDLPPDDDQIIGITLLRVDEEVSGEIVALGIVTNTLYNSDPLISGTSIATSNGNDLILGVAVSEGADHTTGIRTALLDADEGDDVVIGAAFTRQYFETRTDNSGIFASTSLVIGPGSDIVVGSALSIAESEMGMTNFGIFAGEISMFSPMPDQDAHDEEANLVIGVAATAQEDEPADFVFFSGQGINTETIAGSQGDDTIIGLAGAALGDHSTLRDVVGINVQDVVLLDGANLLAGIVYANLGGDADISFVAGLSIAGSITGGADEDIILGALSLEFAAVLDGQEDVFALVAGEPTPNGFTIETQGGADLVAGIAQFDIASSNDAISDVAGIFGARIDTGADADIVIGIAGSVAGTSGTFGIVGATFDADGLINPDIELGGGDDFLFARGSTNGLDDVRINGGSGNDVFDIQGGTGRIDGGDDVDTIVLVGNKADYTVEFDTDQVDADSSADLVVRDNEGTFIQFHDIEFIMFADETVDIDALFI